MNEPHPEIDLPKLMRMWVESKREDALSDLDTATQLSNETGLPVPLILKEMGFQVVSQFE